MKFVFRILTLTLCFFGLQMATSFADETDRNNAIVRIFGVEAGSGFIVSDRGYVVTAHHVLGAKFREGDLVDVGYRSANIDESNRSAEIIELLPENDLALLKLDTTTPEERFDFLLIADAYSMDIKDKFEALGFHRSNPDPVSKSGRIDSLTGPRRSQTGPTEIRPDVMWEVTGSFTEGYSGGPVFAENSDAVFGSVFGTVRDEPSIKYINPFFFKDGKLKSALNSGYATFASRGKTVVLKSYGYNGSDSNNQMIKYLEKRVEISDHRTCAEAGFSRDKEKIASWTYNSDKTDATNALMPQLLERGEPYCAIEIARDLLVHRSDKVQVFACTLNYYLERSADEIAQTLFDKAIFPSLTYRSDKKELDPSLEGNGSKIAEIAGDCKIP